MVITSRGYAALASGIILEKGDSVRKVQIMAHSAGPRRTWCSSPGLDCQAGPHGPLWLACHSMTRRASRTAGMPLTCVRGQQRAPPDSGLCRPPWEYSFGERHPDHGLLGCNFDLPILWLSLFDADGLVTWPRRDNSHPVTTIAQPTGECIERSGARLQQWSSRWPQVFGDMTEPWLSHIGAVQDAYLAIWTQELAAYFEDWPVELHLDYHRGDPELADAIKALSEWESSHTKLRTYLNCLDDPESPGFREALYQVGLQPDGRFQPKGGPVGVATAGYTAPWAPRQAPWDEPPGGTPLTR